MEDLDLNKLWFGGIILIKVYAIFAVIMFIAFRFRLIRKMFLGGYLSSQEQLIVGTGTSILSILAGKWVLFSKTPQLFPLIAGYYGGWQVGFIGGLFLFIWASIIHLHPVVVLCLGISGVVGYLIRRFVPKNQLTYLSFIAGISNVAVWAFSPLFNFTSFPVYHFATDRFIIRIIFLMIIIVPAFYWLCRLLEYMAGEEERESAKLLLEETKYKFLKAQIQPHFLFNALNTIASFIKSKPDEAEMLIVKLSQFLLHSFNQQQKYWPLEKELELLDTYLAIEKARFGNRLLIKIEVDEKIRNNFIPPMLLQPLVENAIKHGISVKPEGGTVSVRAYSCDGGIQFEVADDGVGFVQDATKINKSEREGIGLDNVRQRVYDLGGSQTSFTIVSSPKQGTIISFYLPKISYTTNC